MLRVGLLCDLPEEGWRSMDLVAERLEHHLRTDHASVAVTRLCPPFVHRLGRWLRPPIGGGPPTVDRIINRYVDYPRWLRREAVGARFDVFHVVDHSYAHLVRLLPLGRTVVTCHDLDAFRGVLDPLACPQSRPRRALAARSLAGLKAAAAVVCVTQAVRDELVGHCVVPAGRVTVVPNGVADGFSDVADPATDAEVMALLGAPAIETPEILHVGSTIPRKRIDRLLNVFARVVDRVPGVRLIRVGGAFTADQQAYAERLGLADRITVLPFLDQSVLSAVYRRATLTVLTSDAEGFGLPLIEALASGTPIVASDLPVLREVGGEAVSYCRPADMEHWTTTILDLLRERDQDPARWLTRRQRGVRHARGFSWEVFAAQMVRLYQALDQRTGGSSDSASGAVGGVLA